MTSSPIDAGDPTLATALAMAVVAAAAALILVGVLDPASHSSLEVSSALGIAAGATGVELLRRRGAVGPPLAGRVQVGLGGLLWLLLLARHGTPLGPAIAWGGALVVAAYAMGPRGLGRRWAVGVALVFGVGLVIGLPAQAPPGGLLILHTAGAMLVVMLCLAVRSRQQAELATALATTRASLVTAARTQRSLRETLDAAVHFTREEAAQARRAAQAREELVALVGRRLDDRVQALGAALSDLERAAPGAPPAATAARRAALQRLQRLAADVGDLAEPPTLTPEPLDPAVLLAEVGADLADSAMIQGVSVETRCTARGRWSGDAELLRRAWGALADNAVRFGEGSPVTLRARNGPRGALRLEVHDGGPGIPEAARGRVTRAFEQADGSTTRRHGGAGLGLAVARRIADLHRGDLLLEESPSGGLAAILEIPGDVDAP
jgi:signal transduction histidine kinase